MLIRAFSDLHVDCPGPIPEIDTADCDVIAIVGDVSERLSTHALDWLVANVGSADVPVIYVPGNHDYYRCRWPSEIDKARPLFEAAGIHLLTRGETVTIDSTLFVGATLWTDYAISGDTHQAMVAAGDRRTGMNDHHRIRYGGGERPFLPRDAAEEHRRCLDEIKAALTMKPAGMASVLLTHHAVSPKSLQHGRVTELMDASYASDLEDLILAYGPDLVIHGHVHRSINYELGWTRVVSNPAGYRRLVGNGPGRALENPAYDPSFTIDLPKYGFRAEAEADVVENAIKGER